MVTYSSCKLHLLILLTGQIVVLEEQKVESSEQMEDENKPDDGNSDAIETTSRGDEKPDMNDTPMDENQVSIASFFSSFSLVVHLVCAILLGSLYQNLRSLCLWTSPILLGFHN